MKKLQIRLSLLLCLSLILSTLLGWLPPVSSYATAEAATKTTINKWSKTKNIGIQGTYEGISLDNIKKGATYTYTSSDKSIVKVTTDKKYPDYAALKGLKTGTATITVQQTYKKKTTTIGTAKVTVKNSAINKDAVCETAIGTPSWKLSLAQDYYINYMNYKAKYTFTSLDTDTLEISSDGTIKNAKKTGTVKVSVTETYKKKTRQLGNLTVKIVAPSLSLKNVTIDDEAFYPAYWVTYGYDHTFTFKATDADGKDVTSCIIMEKDGEDAGGYLWAGPKGTYTLSIYDETADMDLGTVTLKVVLDDDEDDDEFDDFDDPDDFY